jgi:hypothetical protein
MQPKTIQTADRMIHSRNSPRRYLHCGVSSLYAASVIRNSIICSLISARGSRIAIVTVSASASIMHDAALLSWPEPLMPS